MVLGEFTHLQTLFLNLITHAIDAMPNGGQLAVKTEDSLFPANEGGVEIAIEDTGVEISEEAKNRIFSNPSVKEIKKGWEVASEKP